MIKSVFFFLGLLLVFGAVGTLDLDPAASLLTPIVLAVVGLILMGVCIPRQGER